MVTMHDVAKHAGVSVMTVSNVVNNRTNVREATRDKVLAAITALDYRVNTTARSLRQGRSGVIGLAVPETHQPYFGTLSALFIDAAAALGYDIVIERTGGASREDEVQAIALSRLRSYDGLILHSSQLADEDAWLFRGDFPIVVMGERSYASPVDHVVMANEQAGRLAAEHLLGQGCRSVVMLGGAPWNPADVNVATSRAKGFIDAVDRAGYPIDPARIRGSAYELEAGRVAVAQLLQNFPDMDGIFCATDMVAFGVIRALHDAGRRVPEDVKVVGFDDVPMAAYATPSLTSIAPDHARMVNDALQLLIGRIDGDRGPDDYREIVAPVHLTPRESTAIQGVT